MIRLPCGTVESHLSALLDDALSGAARERLSAHVLRCRHCSTTLAELRVTRDLIRRAGGAGSDPTRELSQRLMAIGVTRSPMPRNNAPAVAAVATAVGPRRSGLWPRLGVAMVLATMVAVAGIGWESAPTPGAVVADPTTPAQNAYAAAVAAAPLGSVASAAVLTAPAGSLAADATSVRSILTGLSIDRGVPLTRDRVAAVLARATAGGVAHDGVWQVAVGHEQFVGADVVVQARPGQGTQLVVRSADGRQVATAFVPDVARDADDGTAALAEAVRAWGGQRLLGRDAVALEADGAGAVTRRWWVDDLTGLLLRSETSVAGELTEVAGFRELRLGDGSEFLSHLPPALGFTAASASLTTSHALSLQTHGWFCQDEVGTLALASANSDSEAAPGRLHLTYADATQQVTVLQRPGAILETPRGYVRDPDRNVFVRHGWPTVVTWQSGTTVFTVVGVAPAPVLSDVVAGLPHEPATGSGPVDRVRAGWARVGGFVFG